MVEKAAPRSSWGVFFLLVCSRRGGLWRVTECFQERDTEGVVDGRIEVLGPVAWPPEADHADAALGHVGIAGSAQSYLVLDVVEDVQCA